MAARGPSAAKPLDAWDEHLAKMLAETAKESSARFERIVERAKHLGGVGRG